MAAKPAVPHRNRSPYGWWVVGEIQQWVSHRQSKQKRPIAHSLVWENTRLIQAKDREAAYSKALEVARVGMPSKTDGGEWRFAGLSFLLPVHDRLEDGSELVWDDHGIISRERLNRLVRPKKKLAVFDDREPSEYTPAKSRSR